MRAVTTTPADAAPARAAPLMTGTRLGSHVVLAEVGLTIIEAVLVKDVYGGEDAHAGTLASYLVDEAGRLAAQPVEVVTRTIGAAA